ncbi:hypothetical protein V8C37DRAFT_377491, partial [Trichoderma ceciliae]
MANRMKPWLKRSAFRRIFTYESLHYETEEQTASSPPETGDVELRFTLVGQLLAEGVNSVKRTGVLFPRRSTSLCRPSTRFSRTSRDHGLSS